jgi:hypothetical protein
MSANSEVLIRYDEQPVGGHLGAGERGGQRVVLLLQTQKLSLKLMDSLLKSTHLGD